MVRPRRRAAISRANRARGPSVGRAPRRQPRNLPAARPRDSHHPNATKGNTAPPRRENHEGSCPPITVTLETLLRDLIHDAVKREIRAIAEAHTHHRKGAAQVARTARR